MLDHQRSYWKTVIASGSASLATFALTCSASIRWWPFASLGRGWSWAAGVLLGFTALFCGAVAAGGGIALHRDALTRRPTARGEER